jgi:hypothetical protein
MIDVLYSNRPSNRSGGEFRNWDNYFDLFFSVESYIIDDRILIWHIVQTYIYSGVITDMGETGNRTRDYLMRCEDDDRCSLSAHLDVNLIKSVWRTFNRRQWRLWPCASPGVGPNSRNIEEHCSSITRCNPWNELINDRYDSHSIDEIFFQMQCLKASRPIAY